MQVTEMKQTKDSSKLNESDIIAALKKEASTNPVFNSVCHVFAMRERARQQVTVPSLRFRMQVEGFDYTKEQYVNVLRYMASLGIGVLAFDRNKEVKALIQINITLQSIGNVAVGLGNKLDSFKSQVEPKLKMKPITMHNHTTVPLPTKPVLPVTKEKVLTQPSFTDTLAVSLIVYVDGKPVTFNLPKGLTTKEFGEVLADLYSYRGNA